MKKGMRIFLVFVILVSFAPSAFGGKKDSLKKLCKRAEKEFYTYSEGVKAKCYVLGKAEGIGLLVKKVVSSADAIPYAASFAFIAIAKASLELGLKDDQLPDFVAVSIPVDYRKPTKVFIFAMDWTTVSVCVFGFLMTSNQEDFLDCIMLKSTKDVRRIVLNEKIQGIDE